MKRFVSIITVLTVLLTWQVSQSLAAVAEYCVGGNIDGCPSGCIKALNHREPACGISKTKGTACCQYMKSFFNCNGSSCNPGSVIDLTRDVAPYTDVSGPTPVLGECTNVAGGGNRCQ